MRALVAELYTGEGPVARAYGYFLLAFDAAMIVYVIASSFFVGAGVIEIVDVVLGVFIVFDFAARIAVSRHRWHLLMSPAGLADVVVIFSLMAPIAGEGFAFLRVVRTLRLLRSYHLLKQLHRDFPFFRRHQALLFAAINLGVFIFVTTALVFETQHGTNPQIRNYTDALYFTVTTLTTTGFGDITLSGSGGRLIAVAIMIFGVSLFLRLIQVIFRPPRVEHECPDCGLSRHEPDAVHCRHCGHLLHIRTEGMS